MATIALERALLVRMNWISLCNRVEIFVDYLEFVVLSMEMVSNVVLILALLLTKWTRVYVVH